MVMVSSDAMEYIEAKVAQSESARPPSKDDIPLLAWANRAYLDDKAGNRTEYGPHFVFGWTNVDEIGQYDYLTLTLANGHSLALAPGDLFRARSCSILRRGDAIVFVPSD
jgi:hypothetical protein